MNTLLAMALEPSNIAAWLVIGVAAGWLASKAMQAPAYGLIGDLALGAIGGLVGGFVFGFFGDGGNSGFLLSLLISFVGACIFIAVARFIAKSRNA